MKGFVLSQVGRLLFPWLILLSLILLYRGHNLPGGGFIGGLLGATGYILLGLGDGMEQAKQRLRFSPVTLLGTGLAIAMLSGLPQLFVGDALMTGAWLPDFYLPVLGKVHLGTPLVFDIGVYLAVVGFVLHSTFSLAHLAEAGKGEVE